MALRRLLWKAEPNSRKATSPILIGSRQRLRLPEIARIAAEIVARAAADVRAAAEVVVIVVVMAGVVVAAAVTVGMVAALVAEGTNKNYHEEH